MTTNQEQFITFTMSADNATLVSLCIDVYQRKFDHITNKYSNLSFEDETVLEEFWFCNACAFEDTIITENDNRNTATTTQMMYDAYKFIDIRDRMNKLIGELRALEDSACDWLPDLQNHAESLRNFLEMWTEHTQNISNDCQFLAREFEARQ